MVMTAKEKTEFAILQKDVKHIKAEVSDTKNNISNINDKMNKISSKLFNDDQTGEKGYFDWTRRNSVRLTRLENFKIIVVGVAGVVITIFAKIMFF